MEGIAYNTSSILETHDYVTPEMFGAVGDGETDDTQAIINALVAANTSGLLIIGTGSYKVSSVTINNDNTVMYLKNLVCSGDALVVTSRFNNLEFETITSTGGNGVVFNNGKYTSLKASVISANTDAIKLISENDSVMYNDITVCEVFGAVGIHLTYTDASDNDEWVNENIFHVWSFHSPIGVHVDGASAQKCNANVFYDASFELCTTAAIVIDGATQYNKFLNCRNEEVTPNRVLVQLNGLARANVFDFKSPAYATNFVCGNENTTSSTGVPNIITNGLYTPENSLMWAGHVAFTNDGSTPIVYPLENRGQRTLYLGSTTAEINPRTSPDLCRCTSIIVEGERTLEVSEDYGYLKGELPNFVIVRDSKLVLTRNGATLATLTNTLSDEYWVTKQLHFVDATTVISTN